MRETRTHAIIVLLWHAQVVVEGEGEGIGRVFLEVTLAHVEAIPVWGMSSRIETGISKMR